MPCARLLPPAACFASRRAPTPPRPCALARTHPARRPPRSAPPAGEEQSCPNPEAFVADVAAFFDRLNAETKATGATVSSAAHSCLLCW